ncbi:hypothetical protein [Bacillus alveayuensis]|uniref:hypothetical protein n=1 Tax=Aeribacillus alveayuensis TaxID=279215 RepID=UPI0006985BBC|nr:hypothetical protein [Bacillus alveayuensis]
MGNRVEKKFQWFYFFMIGILLFYMVQNSLSRVSSWDEVDFALGVVQYDLLRMQPHFPGYPYFILGGMLFSTFLQDPIKSLVYFNIFIYITSFFPIYQLAKTAVQNRGLFVTSFVVSFPFLTVITVQPMSEGAAIAAMWWFLWSLIYARNQNRQWLKLLPSFLFSILLGIRLSYIPLGIGLIWLWFEEWRDHKNWKKIIVHLLFALFFQSVWIFGLILSEGSLHSFLSLAISFINGHFSDWGGAITVESDGSIGERLSQFVLYNLLWTGISGQSVILSILYLVLLGIALAFSIKGRLTLDVLLISSFVAYFFWALLAQNIEKPRHVLPLASICVFFIWKKCLLSFRKRTFIWFMTAVFVFQAYVSIDLLVKQKNETPAVHQFIHFLNEQKEPFIVYTWEETRVMEYENVSFQHKRLMTYSLFLQDISYYEDRTIYVTNHVVEGFEQQGFDISNRLEKVAEFSSSEIFDPVYSKIILYKWE